MGGDGGQVIDRATMVKTRGYGLTKERPGSYNNSLGEMNSYMQMVSEDRGLGALELHSFRMSACWLSQEVLRDPVVACRLGNLYNKEALINALLNKSIPQEISHVRALKDVKQCLITWKEAENEKSRRRMVCPVSREDLDAGSSRAVIIWTTGAVVSPKSLKELKLKECPVTGKGFDADKDVIPLAAQGEELERLRERLPSSKKRKGVLAAGADGTAGHGGTSAASSSKEGVEPMSVVRAPTSASVEPTTKVARLAQSEVYKGLFLKGGGDGFTGIHDPLGTPVYNRGSRVI